MVSRGITYAVALQTPQGEIYWARNRDGAADKMALLTGCSSIYMSLKCALAIAEALGVKKPAWLKARDLYWADATATGPIVHMIKSRFSMDGYYPILCGAVPRRRGQKEYRPPGDKFVVPTGRALRERPALGDDADTSCLC